MSYCSYYQVRIKPENTWFFVATLRAHEHLAFDRTLNKETGVFEIFVPQEREEEFNTIMAYYVREHIVQDFTQLPNRLIDPKETI